VQKFTSQNDFLLLSIHALVKTVGIKRNFILWGDDWAHEIFSLEVDEGITACTSKMCFPASSGRFMVEHVASEVMCSLQDVRKPSVTPF